MRQSISLGDENLLVTDLPLLKKSVDDSFAIVVKQDDIAKSKFRHSDRTKPDDIVDSEKWRHASTYNAARDLLFRVQHSTGYLPGSNIGVGQLETFVSIHLAYARSHAVGAILKLLFG